MNKLRVSVIIPAYNEDKTVGKIVNLLLNSSLIDEVICVNDGSTDKTYSILKSFGKKIALVNYKKNRGKGFALSKGIKKANGDLVMFIDGDLKNLSNVHIKTLLLPIFKKRCNGVIGIPLRNKRNPRNNIAVYFLDKYITGERVYFKEYLTPHLKRMAKTGYGVEIFLNSLFKKNQVKKVFLKNLISPNKESKWSIDRVLKSYAVAGADITSELGKQIIKNQYKKIKNSTFLNTFVDSLTE